MAELHLLTSLKTSLSVDARHGKMGNTEDLSSRIDRIIDNDSRYSKEAYIFMFGALEYTLEQIGERRHVTGQELLRGISDYGWQQYGPMTKLVLRHWGVRTTEDFGNIVFSLVDAGLMGKTEEDSIDDFKDVYDFDEEFDWKRRDSRST